jgi:hypothetical protein
LEVNPAIEQMLNYGGRIDTTFAALMRTRPMVTFSTYNLGLLSTIGISGAAITATFVAYFTKYAHGGTRTDSAAVSFTVNDGLIVLRRVRASHGGEAVAEFEVYATYDGTNNPVVPASGATVPADATAVVKYTLGPLKYGSVALEMQDAEFDLGAQVIRSGYNGESFDRLAAIANRQPVFRGRTLDLAIATSLTGLGASAAAVLFFRKKTNKGNTEADASAVHLKLTATGAYWAWGAASAGEGSEAGMDVQASLIWDLTNAVVAIDLASAIA